MRLPGSHAWLIVVVALAALSLPATAAVPAATGTVGSEACSDCHDPSELGMGNVHMRIEPFEVGGRTVGCEGCHGPGAAHAEEGDAELIRSFDADDYLAGDACLTCHRTKHLSEWHVSVHAAEEVACVSCHSIHAESEPEAGCRDCHAEQVLQFRLPSRHPVPEGKMSCASCHDVHGATEGMLKTRMRKNDLCFTCHQAQEGPYIFEHAPVQEDCSNCHAPHGAVADNLLTANEPMLCLQCHELHFHAGYRASDDHEVDVGGFERENPFGPPGLTIAFTTNCTQCHAQIHGSDFPAQTVPGSGKGLIR